MWTIGESFAMGRRARAVLITSKSTGYRLPSMLSQSSLRHWMEKFCKKLNGTPGQATLSFLSSPKLSCRYSTSRVIHFSKGTGEYSLYAK